MNIIRGKYEDEVVNISLVTSSEKVMCVVGDVFHYGLHHLENINIDVIFSRPNYPMIGPTDVNDLNKYIKENRLQRFKK